MILTLTVSNETNQYIFNAMSLLSRNTVNSNPRLIRTIFVGPEEFELTRIYCIKKHEQWRLFVFVNPRHLQDLEEIGYLYKGSRKIFF